ncbi:hypothetical protein QBC39DRAFT_248076 [Podospora conica]|nr:hypothetical protein QBC39DRAFT_248076 [Schizothecium conicum]
MTSLLLLLSPTTTVAAASLPYIPTSILLPPGSSTAFILSPNDATSSVDLLSIDLSSPINPATFKPHPISTSLPFFPRGSTNIAFTPSVLANGTIAVFAGDCSVSTSAALWTYTPTNTGGTWTRHATAPGASWDYGQGGPYHLGGSVAFSQQLAPVISPATFYVYGGMCPATKSSSAAGWEQQAATYSNRMLRLTPPTAKSAASGYTVSYAPSTGPPIAEAGFTLTTLAPSISNRSGIVTHQAGHVLLGGHTQQAFINMSTAAIWSLPEEQWSFVGIALPGSTGRTDLTVKNDVAVVDSRSGHTAVLSEDGTKLVVYGGWVGDVATPAEPQVAVVNIGAAFGDWKWEVPSGGQPGNGVYGHGATLLPGNVMMVYGGKTISGGNKGKRAEDDMRFFDINKMSWTERYTPPAPGSGSGSGTAGGTSGTNPDGSPKSGSTPNSSGGGSGGGTSGSSPDGSTSSSDDKSNLPLTLGLTLGLALPLLLAALLAIACLVRRRSRRRAQRDEALSNLAQGLPAHGYHHRASGSTGSNGDMIQRSTPDDDIFMPWNAASARDWYTGGGDAYSQGRRSLGFETLRRQDNYSGADIPPPLFTPGVGAGNAQRPRNTVAKGLYTPTHTGGYDFLPLRGPGGNEIHPIYEEDDEDGDLASPNRKSVLLPDDPFATPPAARSPTHGPSSSAQDPEVQGWVSEVDAADAVLVSKIARHGSTTTTPPRFSPQAQGDDRTNSNLSDRSAFSFVAGAEGRLTTNRPGTGGTSSGASFSTAKSTFAALQSEGPDLLLRPGYQQQTTPTRNNFDYHHHEDSEEEEFPHIPSSPSKSKPRRYPSGGHRPLSASNWLGSLKRVFSNPSPEPSSSDSNSRTRESLLDGSNASSTDFDAAAAGRALLARRRKQGREAWDGEYGAGGEGDDGEWDVERAVEQRLVQVMFSVPKAKLRVVNGEECEGVLEGGSDDGGEGERGGVQGEGVWLRGGGGEGEGSVFTTSTATTAITADKEEEEEDARGRERDGLLLRPDEGGIHVKKRRSAQVLCEGDRLAGLSPSASLRTSSITTNTCIQMAEEVRMERPIKTRVLKMVESIESRGSSPGGSPVRGG